MRHTLFRLILLVVFCSPVWAADEIILKDRHPNEYVIKKGDTLWDIASRFLRDPWRWPDIWVINPKIENPHLIFPGDKVVLTFKDGKPQLELVRGSAASSTSSEELRTIKLTPEIRREPLTQPIPTIPTDAIQQFLLRPHVVSKNELERAPYIVSTRDDHLVAGTGDRIYVKGLQNSGNIRYLVYRPGQAYEDSEEEDRGILGYEAIYVGEAVVIEFGEISAVELSHTAREVLVGDRLVPATTQQLDTSFIPHAPGVSIRGHIIGVVDGVSRIGQYQVVVVNRGENDKLEKGHVLTVFQSGQEVKDVEGSIFGGKVSLPAERAGYLIVFRTFDQVSYALVMKAFRDLSLQDMVRNP